MRTAEQARTDIQNRANSFQDAQFEYKTPAERQHAITSIRLSLGDHIKNDVTRRKVLGWIFLPGLDMEYSTKDLTDWQLEALKKWLQIFPIGDEWTISKFAAEEIKKMVEIITGEKPAPAIAGIMEQEAVKLGGEITNALGGQDDRKVAPQKPVQRLFSFE